ncbi:acyl-CoA synthetase [Shouchella clausii]|uniref:acyl-CoA synthetase n=1 Tax=Shouchella clausii TaxID=79880 RepID=UPI000BA73C1E|nr:acyl--CoA ligase [Shouchella clausii]MCY1103951.1 acyl--CoA ligase [Shouchella clausii]MEB5481423.1 acyl--CoA ligase [Shouchella clausii]PAD09237.1 acyl--CoA ligase [Shouchella clausii]PAD14166.1 acyl--CoA ligase [Shouchella clausii]PAE79937.1 acyl--CoA ligase [Shouchella clausii]
MEQVLQAPQSYNVAATIEREAIRTQKAIIWQNEAGDKVEWTYEDLIQKMNQLANALSRTGLEKGDPVLLLFPRVPEAYAAYLACLKGGFVIIPCSGMLRAKDLAYRLSHSQAKGVLAYKGFTAEIDKISDGSTDGLIAKWVFGEAPGGWENADDRMKCESASFEREMDKEEIAFLPYTSGTTGNPKAVVHTQAWAFAHLQTAATEWLGVETGDLVWATAAPGWQKWVWSPFLSVVGKQATAFVYDGPFQAKTYLQLIDEYGIDVFCATPTEYRMLAKEEALSSFKLSSIKHAVSAGEPLNRAVIATFQEQFDITVRDGYGQTENTLLIGTMIGMEARPGSMGKPTTGNGVVILNEAGEEAGIGEVGDIAVHKDAPALFREYYKDPERTKAAYRGSYYLTGDRAYRDEEGYFWFEGRSDDIIISSGYTIGPFEVEDALTKHPAVKECAVVASPDEIRGHIVKAFVVLNRPTNDQNKLTKELQEFVKRETAPYKYPRAIEYVAGLPKTISGKIRRIELRQLSES